MPAKVLISPLAKEDFKEAIQWYKTRNPELSRRLFKEIRRSTDQIAENPLLFAISYSEIRVAVVSKFPYTLHYYFRKDINTIFIAGIFHTSLNPQKWDKRE